MRIILGLTQNKYVSSTFIFTIHFTSIAIRHHRNHTRNPTNTLVSGKKHDRRQSNVLVKFIIGLNNRSLIAWRYFLISWYCLFQIKDFQSAHGLDSCHADSNANLRSLMSMDDCYFVRYRSRIDPNRVILRGRKT